MYSMSTKNDPQVLIEDLWSDLRSRGVNPSSLRKSMKLCCPDLKEIVNGGETSVTESCGKTFNANNKIVKE